MRKKFAIIISFIILLCAGIGLFIFFNEDHELASPLRINSEIAPFVQIILEGIEETNRNSYTTVASITNTGEQDIFINGTHSFEYFDGSDWLAISADSVGSSSGQLISAGATEFMGYNFDAPRRAVDLFRLRIPIALTANLNEDEHHDLVIEFSLSD